MKSFFLKKAFNQSAKKLSRRKSIYFFSVHAKGKLSAEEYKNVLEGKHFHTATVAFPDPYGRVMGKRFDLETFKYEDLIKDGGHACSSLLADDMDCSLSEEIADWNSGYGDFHMIPDESSIRKMWSDKHLIMMCD